MYAPNKAGVYLLHFEAKYKHAQHYIGCSTNIGPRLHAHQTGQSGCKLVRAARLAGIGITLARIWPGASWDFERRLHRRKNSRELCPLCNPKALKHTGNPRMPRGYTDPF